MIKAEKVEEKEATATACQLVLELKKAAKAMPKAQKKQPKSVAPKAKKAAPAVSKSLKALVKAKKPPKSPVKHVVEAPIEGVVASEVITTTRSKRAVKLPQRFI